MPYHKQTAACTVAQKAIGYGMPGIQVDGNDIFAVYRATREALERARGGEGPTLIEAHTYRLGDHTTSDDARRYREAEDVAEWEAKDPLLRLGLYMRAQGLLDDAEEQSVGEAADQRVGDAVEIFESMDPPSPEEIFTHVYAEMPHHLEQQQEELLLRLKGKG